MEELSLERLTIGVDLSKKNIHTKVEEFFSEIVENGDFSLDAYAKVRKIKEAVDKLESLMKEEAYSELSVTEMTETIRGVEMRMSSTGARYDYDYDPHYLELKRQLKNREELLKLRQKDESIQVPKVPLKTPSKGVLTVKVL